MAPLTAADIDSALSKNNLYSGALSQYLTRLNFKDGSEVGGKIDSELRNILEEREQCISGKPAATVSVSLSSEQKTRVEELFPELRIKFTDSSHSDHPVANALRTCINALFYHQLSGGPVIDVGGSLTYHIGNRHQDVHVCNPVLSGKDVLRRQIEMDGLRRMSTNTANLTDVRYSKSLETCISCQSRMHECQYSAPSAMCVDVYDMSLYYIVNAMEERDIDRMLVALMLPVELLEKKGEVVLRDTDTVVRWEEKLISKSYAKYFINGKGDAFSHDLDNLRAFLNVGRLVSRNSNCYHVVLDSIRGDYKLFSIIRARNDVGLHTDVRRIPTTLSGMYKVSIPKNRPEGTDLQEVYLDKDFVARVKSYLVNTTATTNERNFEYAMSCVRSQKTHLVVGSRVIHSKVEMEANQMPHIVATFLRDSVRSRALALEIANLGAYEQWGCWSIVKFVCNALWSWLTHSIKRLLFVLLKYTFPKYHAFITSLKKPIVPVEEYVEVKLLDNKHFFDYETIFVDHEKQYSRVVETSKKKAMEASTNELRKLLAEAVANKIDADTFVQRAATMDLTPDSLTEMWALINKESKAAKAADIESSAIKNVSKDARVLNKELEERMKSDAFNLADIDRIRRISRGEPVSRDSATDAVEGRTEKADNVADREEGGACFSDVSSQGGRPFARGVRVEEVDVPKEKDNQPEKKFLSVEYDTLSTPSECLPRYIMGKGKDGDTFFVVDEKDREARAKELERRRLARERLQRWGDVSESTEVSSLSATNSEKEFSIHTCDSTEASDVGDEAGILVEKHAVEQRMQNCQVPPVGVLREKTAEDDKYDSLQAQLARLNKKLDRIQSKKPVRGRSIRTMTRQYLSGKRASKLGQFELRAPQALKINEPTSALGTPARPEGVVGKGKLQIPDDITGSDTSSVSSVLLDVGESSKARAKSRPAAIPTQRESSARIVEPAAVRDVVAREPSAEPSLKEPGKTSATADKRAEQRPVSTDSATANSGAGANIVGESDALLRRGTERQRPKFASAPTKVPNSNSEGCKQQNTATADKRPTRGFESGSDEDVPAKHDSPHGAQHDYDASDKSSEGGDPAYIRPLTTDGCFYSGKEKLEESILEDLMCEPNEESTLDIFKKCLLPGCDWAVAKEPIFAMRRGISCPIRSLPAEYKDCAAVEYMLHTSVTCHDIFSKYQKLCGQVTRLNRSGVVSQGVKDSFRSLSVFRKHSEYVVIGNDRVSPMGAFAIFDIEECRFISAEDMKNSADALKWFAVCDDLYKGIPFRILKSAARIARNVSVDEAFKKVKVTLENTPPGGGKTTRLVDEYLKMPNQTLVVTANAGSAEDINTEVARRTNKPKKRVAKTADSRIMNWVSTMPMAVCRIDECFLMHFGQLKFVSVLSKTDNIVLYGDENQIPFINRLPGFRCKREVLEVNDIKCKHLNGSYRCPSDVCAYLSLLKKDDGTYCYPNGVKKLNGKRPVKSVSKSSILSCDDVPIEGFDVYLTYTQDEKAQMRRSLLNRRCKTPVMTVHECQGKTFENVAVVRTKPADDIVFDSLGHHIVVVSRHTVSMKYFTLTRKLNDKLGKAVSSMSTMQDEILRGIEYQQCS
uniref:Leader protease n=1 Tax=Sisal-associated Closterovirus A TaxID=2863240 RepID=A0A8F9EED0_9CLOS|nr:MAG: hypothetical protein [Sisal-associated Closterovirus A]